MHVLSIVDEVQNPIVWGWRNWRTWIIAAEKSRNVDQNQSKGEGYTEEQNKGPTATYRPPITQRLAMDPDITERPIDPTYFQGSKSNNRDPSRNKKSQQKELTILTFSFWLF